MSLFRWNHCVKRSLAATVILVCGVWTSVATAQTCTQLKVTAHPDYPPLAWTAGDKMEGALIRVMERFSKSTGTPILAKPAKTWEDAQSLTIAGEADLILGLYRTPQRATELLFVERPVATDPIGVFVRQDMADDVDDIGDLRGLKGASASGESFGADFDLRISKQLSLFRTENIDAAFKFLKDKQADFVLSGLYNGLSHLRKTGPGHGVALTQASLIPSQPLYVAFSRKSPCLSMAAALESFLERITARGDMEGLTAEAMMRWAAK